MKFNVFIILFIPLIVCASKDEPCRAHDGTRGRCVVLQECDAIYNKLQSPEKAGLTHDQAISIVRGKQCGFEDADPKVCCPSKKAQKHKSTSSSTNHKISFHINEESIPVTFTKKPPYISNVHTTRKPLPPTHSFKTFAEYIYSKLQLLPHNCGRSLSYKYFVGNISKIDDFPWVVLLEYEMPGGQKKIGCGGVLINKNYVLTAAHCVTDLKNDLRLSAVLLGEYDMNSHVDCLPEGDLENTQFCADKPIRLEIKETLVHHGYASTIIHRQNDIALLRLASPATFSRFISPACLPTKLPIPQIFYASGWGKTLNNEGYLLKHLSAMLLRSEESCKKEKKINLVDGQFCADAKLPENGCISDEGGPLMGVEEKADGSRRSTVFGILSYIRTPTSVCSGNFPGVYTNILDYVTWILHWIKE